MRDEFYSYLVMRGFKEYTPKGRKSTVYSYCNRVDLVCRLEDMTWEHLSQCIAEVLDQYDIGGENEIIGLNSNATTINALRAFSDFCDQLV